MCVARVLLRRLPIVFMGYKFEFSCADASRAAVLDLNNACKRMKIVWEGIVQQWAQNIADGLTLPADMSPLFHFLADFLKDDSGAEIFYFVTPPESTSVMARRLCAALRLVAETIYEEEGLEMLTDVAKPLQLKTMWSAHCSKAGERKVRESAGMSVGGAPYRHDIINVEWIKEIKRMVDGLNDEVAGRFQ